ncbi:hypothetical protein COLO4_13523 [Corchorus olitorius]|uniref:Uncharacterized protein n=1 Tax=Corchorus olitorius TaxID=93759 RepID=A0A1R3JW81_9ROSI|nr:hypothetical protein COLO4_13523 [Corchorus olitorius]
MGEMIIEPEPAPDEKNRRPLTLHFSSRRLQDNL